MGGYKWMEEEIEILREQYGLCHPREIASTINKLRKKRGLPPRTENAVLKKAFKIDADICPDGMIPLRDVIGRCAAGSSGVYSYAKKLLKSPGRKKVIGNSRYRFISPDVAEKIESHFKKPPEHYIQASTASLSMGFSRNNLAERITKNNSIPWVKNGRVYFIPDWVVDAGNLYLKKTGSTTVNWHQAISDYAKKGFTFRHREAQEFLEQRLKSG